MLTGQGGPSLVRPAPTFYDSYAQPKLDSHPDKQNYPRGASADFTYTFTSYCLISYQQEQTHYFAFTFLEMDEWVKDSVSSYPVSRKGRIWLSPMMFLELG